MKLEKNPNREGGSQPDSTQNPNLLSKQVFKNAQNALKLIINTKTFLFICRGVGLTFRKICLVSFLHLVYRENIMKNDKIF